MDFINIATSILSIASLVSRYNNKNINNFVNIVCPYMTQLYPDSVDYFHLNEASPFYQRRLRGKRAGVRKRQYKQNNIPRVDSRRPFTTYSSRGCDTTNLTYINAYSTKRNNNCVSNNQTGDDTQLQRVNNVAKKTGNINIGYLNAQSVRNKTEEIVDLVIDRKLDMLFLTETWLAPYGDEAKIASLTPPGFITRSLPRHERRGGGIAVIYRRSLDPKFSIKPQSPSDYTSFEVLNCSLDLGNNSVNFIAIYRPPNTPKAIFIKEFQELLSNSNMTKGSPLILGDFNFHFNHQLPTPDTRQILQILQTFNMEQIITAPTHRLGHTLDWMIKSSDIIECVSVVDQCISDHYTIFATLCIKRPLPEKTIIKARNIKNIDIQAFRDDLSAAINTTEELNIEKLNTILQGAVDDHAPLMKRTVNIRKSSPWFNSDVKEAKRKKRQAERKWIKTKLDSHKELYIKSKTNLKRTMHKAKKEYYNVKLSETNNSRQFFRLCSELLGDDNNVILPSTVEPNVLPEKFSSFFCDKIKKIRTELDQNSKPADFELFTGKDKLSSFKEATEEEVANIIRSSPPKSCDLDPIPTDLLKRCLDILLPSITHIVNDSLRSGRVPDAFKTAIVKPLIKKNNLDPENLKNYRPVSNLPFLSKILEKLILARLSKHLKDNDLWQCFQSAYRANHSTETALLKVSNDLLKVIDNGSVSLLTLLDLTAAFDTIDHKILIHRLQITFGISGTALNWFTSYLSNRKQNVLIRDQRSKETPLSFGVPQGSVLGPVLFIIYTSPLAATIQKHSLSCHFYADDTQIYSIDKTRDVKSIINQTESCVQEVKEWMDNNRLKMNEDKTECLIISSKNNLKYNENQIVEIGDAKIEVKNKVKNLGVHFDSEMRMEYQINNLCKVMNFELRKISHIRPFISIDACKKLITSLVFSKLDYSNSLLCGISKKDIQRLQVVQNSAARLTVNKSKFEKASPILAKLHWLPIEKRIKFKANTLVYKFMNGTAPAYISDSLEIYEPVRPLRSSKDKTTLKVPRIRTRAGGRSFSHFGPAVWNDLPTYIRNAETIEIFKKHLKTFYFKH